MEYMLTGQAKMPKDKNNKPGIPQSDWKLLLYGAKAIMERYPQKLICSSVDWCGLQRSQCLPHTYSQESWSQKNFLSAPKAVLEINLLPEWDKRNRQRAMKSTRFFCIKAPKRPLDDNNDCLLSRLQKRKSETFGFFFFLSFFPLSLTSICSPLLGYDKTLISNLYDVTWFCALYFAIFCFILPLWVAPTFWVTYSWVLPNTYPPSHSFAPIPAPSPLVLPLLLSPLLVKILATDLLILRLPVTQLTIFVWPEPAILHLLCIVHTVLWPIFFFPFSTSDIWCIQVQQTALPHHTANIQGFLWPLFLLKRSLLHHVQLRADKIGMRIFLKRSIALGLCCSFSRGYRSHCGGFLSHVSGFDAT